MLIITILCLFGFGLINFADNACVNRGRRHIGNLNLNEPIVQNEWKMILDILDHLEENYKKVAAREARHCNDCGNLQKNQIQKFHNGNNNYEQCQFMTNNNDDSPYNLCQQGTQSIYVENAGGPEDKSDDTYAQESVVMPIHITNIAIDQENPFASNFDQMVEHSSIIDSTTKSIPKILKDKSSTQSWKGLSDQYADKNKEDDLITSDVQFLDQDSRRNNHLKKIKISKDSKEDNLEQKQEHSDLRIQVKDKSEKQSETSDSDAGENEKENNKHILKISEKQRHKSEDKEMANTSEIIINDEFNSYSTPKNQYEKETMKSMEELKHEMIGFKISPEHGIEYYSSNPKNDQTNESIRTNEEHVNFKNETGEEKTIEDLQNRNLEYSKIKEEEILDGENMEHKGEHMEILKQTQDQNVEDLQKTIQDETSQPEFNNENTEHTITKLEKIEDGNSESEISDIDKDTNKYLNTESEMNGPTQHLNDKTELNDQEMSTNDYTKEIEENSSVSDENIYHRNSENKEENHYIPRIDNEKITNEEIKENFTEDNLQQKNSEEHSEFTTSEQDYLTKTSEETDENNKETTDATKDEETISNMNKNTNNIGKVRNESEESIEEYKEMHNTTYINKDKIVTKDEEDVNNEENNENKNENKEVKKSEEEVNSQDLKIKEQNDDESEINKDNNSSKLEIDDNIKKHFDEKHKTMENNHKFEEQSYSNKYNENAQDKDNINESKMNDESDKINTENNEEKHQSNKYVETIDNTEPTEDFSKDNDLTTADYNEQSKTTIVNHNNIEKNSHERSEETNLSENNKDDKSNEEKSKEEDIKENKELKKENSKEDDNNEEKDIKNYNNIKKQIEKTLNNDDENINNGKEELNDKENQSKNNSKNNEDEEGEEKENISNEKQSKRNKRKYKTEITTSTTIADSSNSDLPTHIMKIPKKRSYLN